MKNKRMLLPALFSIALVFSLILPDSVVGASATVPMPDDCSISHSTVDSSGLASAITLNTPQGQVTPMVAAGWYHTVGLKSDGTVVAVGWNDYYGQCNVGCWMNITHVASGYYHTVGLKTDGTVVAVGANGAGECTVGGWTDITQVAAGGGHTVGLKDDGTVVAVGDNYEGQRNVAGWMNITQVAAGSSYTVGLKDDGTVVAVGLNNHGQCNVGGWTGIIQVAAGGWHTVGLKDDGTVVAVGENYYGRCNVGSWADITQVAAGHEHTVGLKTDGTVVAVGWNDYGQCNVGGWTDITQVAAGYYLTVGLKTDGTVVAAGLEAELAKWNLVLAVPPSQCEEDSSSPGECFIATVAYGTPMAEEIEILREFKDEYLLTSPVGQALVSLYYRVSPPIAEFITEHPGLKPIVRVGLLPAVAMSAVAVNTTPAEKKVIIGLLVLVSVALAIWATRRRGRGPQYT